MSAKHGNAIGSRLLPTTIDKIAADTPERVWGLKPRSSGPSAGYEDITFQHLANAINAMAWFMQQHFGASRTFETVAYLGKPVPYHLRRLLMHLSSAGASTVLAS